MEWLVYIETVICCILFGITDWYLLVYMRRKWIWTAWLGVIIFAQAALISIPIVLLLG